ncbi:rhomboid family intramembrane serine protease [Croceimicrobium hydrocarbonivorans]|uniref:Rhomboid family intramembrane serine protease n=1 Tax=Croceimicrobium hydrocarbonivorans TaxID=2761580 RepID=A0A7H0VFY2_9FLAO|nr:rhomboid family intramembrane serine protease [Croceimicrobium hydrocarbonivorans]QNR24630.1 rhomboid family intramembrane serine protease [Croceimicrobium hydrocarbonivorans]
MLRFNLLPDVIKNLIILNGLFYLGTVVIESTTNFPVTNYLALHYPLSPDFQPFQFVTSIFMHGGLTHLFFNMFALYMFGSALEQIWGGPRFLLYYLLTGIGASFFNLGVEYWQYTSATAELSNSTIELILRGDIDALSLITNESMADISKAFGVIHGSTIGASGAVFGILLAFGMVLPNQPIYFIFFPAPIKAKYLVIGYGLLELSRGLQYNPADNIAHFAHLGGMVIGFLILQYWKKKNGTLMR